MSTPVRLAGHGRRPDGATVTWILAEGRKGRRWRELVMDGPGRGTSLLYETDPEGRFSHLELATPDGLATLHPEPDGTLHGNVVRAPSGVQHVIGVPFPAGTALIVTGSLASAAAARVVADGEGSGVASAVVLDPATLSLAARPMVAADLAGVDADGLPDLADATLWPLEVDGPA